MITKELKKLVREEADKLKATATEKELARLDFDTFMPTRMQYCVYGQIAGYCRSKRAIELLKTCAIPFTGTTTPDWEDVLPVNGFKRTTSDPWTAIIKVFSPIEVYICQPEAKNENLLAYLKGEKKKLVL